MSALEPLAVSLRILARGLREPRFYIALVLALIVWVAAYQNKRDYNLEVANLASNPYLSGFNDVEKSASDPSFLYRWSTGSPAVRVPGIGNQPVQVTISTIGSRPVGQPPLVTFTTRGQQFQLQTHPEEHSDTFFVDRGTSPFDGDLDLKFGVPPFTPPGDPRELGVIIRRVVVQPADYGLRPPVIPPLGTLASLFAGLVGIYILFMLLSHRRRWALASVWMSALLATLGILWARPDLALFAADLPVLLAWTIALGIAAKLIMSLLAQKDHTSFSSVPLAIALLTFAFAFALRYGGLIYPQLRTSDLLLHVHNVQDVLSGNLVFTEPLPDGRPVPYPPAYYLLISAMSLFTGNSDEGLGLALKWTASLLDAATCLALFWAGTRIWRGRSRGLSAGAFASLVYLALPGVFDLFSAGNYTNLFGQSILNIALLGGLVYLAGKGRTGPMAPLLLLLGFGLTMLGHYGMMLGTLGILGIFALWTLINTLRKTDPPEGLGRAWTLLASAGIALIGSFALYYWRFLQDMAGQFGDLFGKLGSGSSTLPPAGTAEAAKPGFGASLLKLPVKVGQLIGWPATLTAAAGTALFPRASSTVRALLLSWLAAGLVFALLDQVVGDSVRWYYLSAAPIALVAGRFLSLLGARSVPARWLTTLLVAAMLLQMLTFWLGLIYTRYH